MSYDHLIQNYAQKTQSSRDAVEKAIFAWFKDNIGKDLSDKTDLHLQQAFYQFKARIKIHSLAAEFAYQVWTKLHMLNSPVVTNGVYASGNTPLLFTTSSRSQSTLVSAVPVAEGPMFFTERLRVL